tara:strand:+ start:246 stop:1010 length:765 start_codon:yes stop_codon:yes gene_type:complete
MRIVAITQARLGSKRFPKKIIKKIQDKTLLNIHIDRIKNSKLINEIIIATTTNENDKKLIHFAKENNVSFYAGSENDVLDRFYNAAKKFNADVIIRLTSDCPLIDSNLIDSMILEFQSIDDIDYLSNVFIESYPDGQDIEVFTFEALKKAWVKSTLKSDREHVTPFIRKNSDYFGNKMFKAKNISSNINYSNVRMTVDEEVDFEVIKILINKLGFNDNWENYTKFYRDNIEIAKLNSHIKRNEGYEKSIMQDEE